MGLFWRILFAYLLTEFPLQLSSFRILKKKWLGFVLKSLLFFIISLFFIYPSITSQTLWSHLGPLFIINLLFNLFHFCLFKVYRYWYSVAWGPIVIINIILIYLLTNKVLVVYFLNYQEIILYTFAVIAVWGIPAAFDYFKSLSNKEALPPDYHPQEPYQKTSFVERALIFLGITKFRYYYFSIPIWTVLIIAFVPRILLKLNKKNVPVPWLKWMTTGLVSGISLVLFNITN